MSTRIAIIGANGQVGAEVCLLLRRRPEFEVVPICRNPTGSAFLRFAGMSCRHGLAADPDQARRLLGDCDVVLNFARSIGRPREALEMNKRIIENSARFSPHGAKILYFSTLCVYRGFRPEGAPPWRTAYGTEKLRCENVTRRAAARTGKEAWVLRLGHVCGEMQNITGALRAMVRAGTVAVPDGGERPSNTVYTVNIVDAVARIVEGRERPGTYDLLSVPALSWREVLEIEASAAGVPLRIETGTTTRPRGPIADLRGFLRDTSVRALRGRALREIGLRLLLRLPERTSARAQALHFRRRAAAEIAALSPHAGAFEAFTFAAAGGRYLSTLASTRSLLERQPPPRAVTTANGALPADLPLFDPASAQPSQA